MRTKKKVMQRATASLEITECVYCDSKRLPYGQQHHARLNWTAECICAALLIGRTSLAVQGIRLICRGPF